MRYFSHGMAKPLLNVYFRNTSSNTFRMKISSFMKLELATELLRWTFSNTFEKSIQRSMIAPNTILLKSVGIW